MKVFLTNLGKMFSGPVLLFIVSELAKLDWNLYLDPKWASLAAVGVTVLGFYAKLIFSGSITNDLEDAK